MAAKTMEQAAANWMKRLNNLREKGLNHIIQQANAIIELEAPSYLDVYRDAVFINDSDFPNSLSLMMTLDSLFDSAYTHADDIEGEGYDVDTYVFGKPRMKEKGFRLSTDGIFGSVTDPYPIRIEQVGSPLRNDGQHAWQHAAQAAKDAIPAALRMATR